MFELGTDGPKSILVAVDGSEPSLRASAYAAGLARRQGAELIAVFVHTAGGLAATRPEAIVGVQESNRSVAAELQRTLSENSARLGLKARLVERHGSPLDEISKVADELRVDAVIVGASSQVGHRFVGALGIHLVKLARWPVTVVP
ncbi:MAG: universal stress protein [Actinobacteria bacterium]|nr:universal stress protein [Actinomycetota bacterium]